MKKIFSVVIGCNYANTPYALDGCINDAMDFSWTITDLCEKRGFHLSLNLLLDNGGNSPTKSNIMNNIKQGISSVNSKQSDLFIFYFAGHGLQHKDTNGDEADGLDETILCSDLQQIVDDQMFLALTRLHKNRQAIFVFDCCHSGTMLDLPKTMIGGGKSGRMRLSGDVLCVSACLENQKSTEKNGRGLFTSALCATLRKRGSNTRLFPLLRIAQRYVQSQTNSMTLAATSSGSIRAANVSLFDLNKAKNGGQTRGIHQTSLYSLAQRQNHNPNRNHNRNRNRNHNPTHHPTHHPTHNRNRNRNRNHTPNRNRNRNRRQSRNKTNFRGEPTGLKDTSDGKCLLSFYKPWKPRKNARTCSCQ